MAHYYLLGYYIELKMTSNCLLCSVIRGPNCEHMARV